MPPPPHKKGQSAKAAIWGDLGPLKRFWDKTLAFCPRWCYHSQQEKEKPL